MVQQRLSHCHSAGKGMLHLCQLVCPCCCMWSAWRSAALGWAARLHPASPKACPFAVITAHMALQSHKCVNTNCMWTSNIKQRWLQGFWRFSLLHVALTLHVVCCCYMLWACKSPAHWLVDSWCRAACVLCCEQTWAHSMQQAQSKDHVTHLK